MSDMTERLKARHGIDPESRSMQRAELLASNDLEFVASLIMLRKAQNITQQDVADRLGISQATVAAFEHPGNDPKLSTIRRYAHAVGALVTHRVALDVYQDLSDWNAAENRRLTSDNFNGQTAAFSFAPGGRVALSNEIEGLIAGKNDTISFNSSPVR